LPYSGIINSNQPSSIQFCSIHKIYPNISNSYSCLRKEYHCNISILVYYPLYSWIPILQLKVVHPCIKGEINVIRCSDTNHIFSQLINHYLLGITLLLEYTKPQKNTILITEPKWGWVLLKKYFQYYNSSPLVSSQQISLV